MNVIANNLWHDDLIKKKKQSIIKYTCKQFVINILSRFICEPRRYDFYRHV